MLGEKTCPRCSAHTADEENFCGNCGYDYTAGKAVVIKMNEARIEGYLEADIASYVEKKDWVYLEKFKKVEQNLFSFNWSAFIFSISWLAYRKMYAWAAVFYGVGLLSGVAVAWLFVKPLVTGQATEAAMALCSILFGLALRVAVGFLADRLYWRKVKRCLDAKGCKDRPAELDKKLQDQLMNAGSVSIWAVVFSTMAELLLQELVLAVLTPMISAMFLKIQ